MSRRATAGVVRPSRRTRARRRRYAAMPAAALHPADAGREQRVVVAVLGEAPAGAIGPPRPRGRRARRRAPARRRGRRRPRAAARRRGTRRRPRRCRSSGRRCPRSPGGGARGCPRCGSLCRQRRCHCGGRLARHLVDAGVLEGGEEQGRAGRAVAPGVGDLVHVGVRRDDVGHHEAAVARVTEGDEVLGPAARRVDEVRPVELGTGDGEGGRDAGQAVRPVRHLRVHVARAAPPR